MVVGILSNKEYTGTAILNRKTSKSYKDHRKYVKPEKEWIVHENAHPAIIDNETFETVQCIRSGRRQVMRTNKKGALDGVIYCPDCGSRQHAKWSSKKNSDGSVKKYFHYVCKNSRSYTEYATCTAHSINRSDAETVVLADLQRVMKLAKTNEQKFAERLNAASYKENERSIQRAKSELAKSMTRIATLDRIISKIYEDNVEGKISDERFQTMLTSYEAEQSELKVKEAELESIISDVTVQTTNIESFLKLVRSHTEVTELNTEIVHEFISRVEVSEAEYTPAKFKNWARGKTQKVLIIYNYLDDISETFKDE